MQKLIEMIVVSEISDEYLILENEARIFKRIFAHKFTKILNMRSCLIIKRVDPKIVKVEESAKNGP